MFELSHGILGLLSILSGIFLFLLWHFHESFQYWKRKNLPYQTPLIPFGNTLDFITGNTTFGEIFSKAYFQFKKEGHKHGGVYYFHTPVYVPVDPNIIKKILIADADNFPSHGFYISSKVDPLSAHLLNMEGAKWRTLRSKTPSSFTSAKMRKMFSMMAGKIDSFTKLLDSCMENSGAIEIKSIVTRFTTDVISACILGVETKTMQFENEELLKHGRSFFDYQWNTYTLSMMLTVPRRILEKFNFRIVRKETENYVMDMFKKLFDYRKIDGPERDDLTDALIRLTEKREAEKDFSGKAVMDPLEFSEFAAVNFGFFAAGFETSSSTQTFGLFELAKNPDCQTRLRDEINKVLGKHDNVLSYDAVMEMKYLDNVVDEILRKYPVLPILPRLSKENYPIPGTDFILEKGTFIIVPLMGLHYDPEYYTNPEKFDPDRFSSENKGSRPHVANLPFGEGPRICVGKRFGLLQTKLGLISIIKNYEVTLNEKTTKDFKFVTDELVLRKDGDIWINLKKIR